MKKLNDEIQIKFRIVTGLWFDASRSYDAERSGGRVETWKRPKVLSALKENVKYPTLNFQYPMFNLHFWLDILNWMFLIGYFQNRELWKTKKGAGKAAKQIIIRLKENVKCPTLNFQYPMKKLNDEIQIKIPIIYRIVVWLFQILRRWKVLW